jgi:hypothetical protein
MTDRSGEGTRDFLRNNTKAHERRPVQKGHLRQALPVLGQFEDADAFEFDGRPARQLPLARPSMTLKNVLSHRVAIREGPCLENRRGKDDVERDETLGIRSI